MKEITWKYVKELEDIEAISKFEIDNNIIFPEDLKNYLQKYNGGRPSSRLFDTAKEKEHEFKTLLSFNKADIETIYKNFPIDSKHEKLIPFASDPAGNYFCLYRNAIYYWHHERDEAEYLADTFEEFLKKLY